MTPQVKAIELIFKFSPLVTIWDCYHDEPRQEQLILQDAKKCTKITVNEIIASIPTEPSTGELERVDAIMFWVNVGQEIDKL
jgi:hypothetical protein